MKTEQSSLLQTYSNDLFASGKTSIHALKDHPQVPTLIDILSRKENHHISLIGPQSNRIKLALLENIASRLTEGNIPRALRNIDFIYFDAKKFATHTDNSEQLKQYFNELCESIYSNEKRIIFAINQYDPTSCLGKIIQSIQYDDHWRLIFLTEQETFLDSQSIELIEPTYAQLLALLKTYKTDLENFHHVLIPEETFASALSMTMHYLTNRRYFDKALELLDSAAARASTAEHFDPTGQMKPLVTSSTLAQIVSNWTGIPVELLHNNAFKTSKFNETLQRQIFGQDTAIQTISSALQHAYLKISEKPGPLCSFIFAGPAETCKTSMAYAIAEHLFGHPQALLHIDMNQQPCHSLSTLNVMTHNHSSLTLLQAIQQTPYAIVLLDNIQQAPASTFNLFRNIFSQGYCFDEKGVKYDFRHAIFIMTTTIDAEHIATLTQTPTLQENQNALDLMDLVLNEQPHHSLAPAQEWCEALMPALEKHISADILEKLHVIPFMPLDYTSFEKIVRVKIKMLAKQLEANFGIELRYAPEVIKFLAHEILWRKPQSKSLEKVLAEHLYAAVANEILAFAEDKNRPRRLSLYLNSTGQLLRCEFISAADSAIYN